MKIVLPKHLKFLLGVYLMGLLLFTGFRVAFFMMQWDLFQELPEERWNLITSALFMGWRFDTSISGYLLAVPLVALTFSALGGLANNQSINNFTTLFLGLVYSIAFIICGADIPYFDYFFTRLNTAAFNWFNTPSFVFNLIFDELAYVGLILVLVLICYGYWRWLFRWKIKTLDVVSNARSIKWHQLLGISLVFMGLTFLGIRGRLDEKSPIRVGTAAFSTHFLPNQMGLNPVFTLMRSFIDDQKAENRSLNYMGDEQAIAQARSYLHVPKNSTYSSPIARKIEADSLEKDFNIVLIMLESMSAEKMGRYGHPLNLTPFLDSLAEVSHTFDSVYTAGIHTFNGLYSTLFSFPALMKQHPMNVVNIPKYDGIANVLRKKGYQTIHFMTHDAQFDNISGFFSSNGYESIISKKDYPPGQVRSTLGVPDHNMFDFALPLLNERHQKGRPFFASFMTTSDHIPYIIPEDIPHQFRNNPLHLQIIEYVDWSLAHFFELASKEPWFENTLFVFLADHGKAVNPIYDMPLSYHHTPLIFYSPTLLPTPQNYPQMGLQIDVFPSIMGLLGKEWVNNTMGLDLFQYERPFAYFTADNKYGVLNDSLFLVIRNDGNESLYRYKTGDTNNHLEAHPELVKEMKAYAETMFHTSQWMMNHSEKLSVVE